MTELDPYVRNIIDANRQVVLAARPITIAQDGADEDGVVQIAANRDIFVIADEVTVRGAIQARSAPANGSLDGPDGRTVVILARSLETIPGTRRDAQGRPEDARLDASGGDGSTSTEIWTAPAASGKDGERGHSIWHPIHDDVADGGAGDPGSQGEPGKKGGKGGKGGTIDLRCGFTTQWTALAIAANGGNGGSGLDGQDGGLGGGGGDGADSQIKFIANPSTATRGGDGGPGGRAGDGGEAGGGGAFGIARLRVRSGKPTGITVSLSVGAHGKVGKAGAPGKGGPGGTGGMQADIDPEKAKALAFGGGIAGYDLLYRVADGRKGDDGGKGFTPDPQQPLSPQDGNADIRPDCDGPGLIESLPSIFTAQTAMLLERVRVDYLAATGSVDMQALSALADRIDWVSALLDAYAPQLQSDIDELDAQRAAAQVVRERFRAALDFYGHAVDYAPLGSMTFYRDRFSRALKALEEIQSECDERTVALQRSNRSASDVDQARKALTQQQDAYAAATASERAIIAGLVTQIRTTDNEAKEKNKVLLHYAVGEFEQAVKNACGIDVSDLIEAVGQFAFFGEHGFQQGAMMAGQLLKLGQVAASKVITEDGTPVEKKWILGQLKAVEFSVQELARLKGGKAGVELSDPGAVKLLAKQSEFDEMCEKFWNVSGAAKAKGAFDGYVSAVQARNAHVLTLNESLARLRAYVADGAQTRFALEAANTQAATNADAGAATLVAQLTRMTSRVRADCIEALYHASRARSFAAIKPADALAALISDLGVGRPLAMTPDALRAAGEQMLEGYDKEIEAGLNSRPIWFPPRGGSATQRGIMIELTRLSHPAVFKRLNKEGTASFELTAPRARTTAECNPFAGLSNVRLTSVRCWLSDVRWREGRGYKVRVDLEHQGREILVGPDDSVVVFRHEPVHVVLEYDSRKPLDPEGITAASDLQDGDGRSVIALIGPFARWRVSVSRDLNPGVVFDRVNKITLEMHGCADSFGMPRNA